MKRAILIAITILAACASVVHAEERERSLNVLLTGGSEPNRISISLSPDGRSYVIDSAAPLEVGGSICTHPEGNPNQIVCEAPAIAGFEVNSGAGDDSVVLARDVPVSVTLRGGPDDDRLVGGSSADKLIGGAGDDLLIGRAGADWLYGGIGNDKLLGGLGDDLLRGGAGRNVLVGGPGKNDVSGRESSG